MITNKTFDEISIGDAAGLKRTLTRRDLDMFALVSGDMNPTHLSEQYARMLSDHGTISGHSMWGASLISSVLGNTLPGPGTVYLSQDLKFHAPTHVGDTLSATVTAKEKNPKDQTVVFDCRVLNQRGEAIVSGVAVVRAPSQKPGCEVSLGDMTYRVRHAFLDLIELCHTWDPLPVAVCHPCSPTALEGAVEAAAERLITPILVGPEQKIRDIARESNIDISAFKLINTEHSHESAEKAVALCREGVAEALMKGSLHTDELMSAVLRSDTGLRTALRTSHVFILDVPTYPKPLLVTDAAINIYPTLTDKVDILKNVIFLAHAVGIKEPKVAILSAVETVNPKIASTLEAAALCKMAERGQITGAIIDGPLAFDNAISKEAARIKEIRSPVAGDADVLLVPDLEAGNILAKQLTYLVDADAAGIVLGARVPIILTSRADTPKARLASCAVAVAAAYYRRKGIEPGKGGPA